MQVWEEKHRDKAGRYGHWGFGLNWGWQHDRLVDLERILMLLDGNTVPDN